MRRVPLIGVALILLASCQREKRDVRPEPARTAVFGSTVPQSELQPGPPLPAITVSNPYHGAAYDISEGSRLYNWFNCSGCHANGAGGIGPPLIKQQWIYGDKPAQIFETIVKGRPNGMPTWGGRIPQYQVWQIVAYIESMNGKQPISATAPRQDTIEKSPENISNQVPGATR